LRILTQRLWPSSQNTSTEVLRQSLINQIFQSLGKVYLQCPQNTPIQQSELRFRTKMKRLVF
jgi:hypothetical protein